MELFEHKWYNRLKGTFAIVRLEAVYCDRKLINELSVGGAMNLVAQFKIKYEILQHL